MSEAIEDTPEQTEQIESPTMEDTIQRTLDEINARETQEPEESGQPRDETGKFTKPEEQQEEVSATEPVVPEPVTIPPELQRLGLRKEEAEAFAKADQAVKDAFIRRSDEMHRGFEQVREKAQFGDQMQKAFAPFMQTIQQLQTTPDVAIQRLMTADQSLRYGNQDQKLQMLVTIARDYGISLDNFAERVQQTPPVDQNVQQLQGQLQAMQNWIQQQNHEREEMERQSLNSEIERFGSDPKHKYFEQVRNDMAGILQAGLATDLEGAYEKAIFANTTIRAQVLAQQQAEADEKRRQEAERKAKEAKQAASINVSRKGKVSTAKPVGTIEETIRAEAERLGLM